MKLSKILFFSTAFFSSLVFQAVQARLQDSALACNERTTGDICGTAEPKARFAEIANVSIADDQALICSAAGFCELEQVSRQPIDPVKYKLSFYNAYRSISRS
jgi:hypothetical protein